MKKHKYVKDNVLNLNVHGIHAQLYSNSRVIIDKINSELNHFVIEHIQDNGDSIKIYFNVVNACTRRKIWYSLKKHGQFVNATEEIFSYTDFEKKRINPGREFVCSLLSRKGFTR